MPPPPPLLSPMLPALKPTLALIVLLLLPSMSVRVLLLVLVLVLVLVVLRAAGCRLRHRAPLGALLSAPRR